MKTIIAILILITVASCSNPSDIDTPRRWDYDDPVEYRKYPATNVTFTISGDNYEENFMPVTEIIIHKGSVYLRIDSGHAEVPDLIQNDMIVSAVTLKLDSVLIDGNILEITNGTDVSPGAEVYFEQNQYNFYDTSVIPNGINNKFSVTFQADTINRVLTGSMEMLLAPYGRAYPESGTITISY